jgi:Fic/DOC family
VDRRGPQGSVVVTVATVVIVEDSHDVLGTFEAVQRDPFYSVMPRDEDEFIDWLRKAHRLVMSGRPGLASGEWKVRANRAGNTLFVLPELVDATLRKAWPLFGTLEQPMAKALFAMFVVSEVHPFTDGNGRISRLIMNAFLSNAQQCRIMVPTLYRDNYLSALKQATHQKDAGAYIRAMRLCQAWSSELKYDVDVAGVVQQLLSTKAVETDTRVHRLLSPRDGEPMGVPEELRGRFSATERPA